MGFGICPIVFLSATGGILIVADYFTKGRNRLNDLILALMVMTFLSGVMGMLLLFLWALARTRLARQKNEGV